MDDLIVLILTLVIGVIGVVGQIKKKKRQSADGPKEKEPGFWDMLEEEIEMETAPQPNRGRQPEAVPVVEPQEKNVKPKYEFTTENKGKSISSDKYAKTRKVSITKEKIRKTKFPLKKAIIYSEILNGKYI